MAPSLENSVDVSGPDSRPQSEERTIGHRTRVLVFPASEINPYFDLIYSEFPRWDLEVVHLADESEIELAGHGDVLHLHWTKTVQKGCSTPAEARAKSDDFLAHLELLQARGVTVIWAIHEAVPHECPFPQVELAFRQALADLSDVVQVLHPATIEALMGSFAISPEKVLVVPHPLYAESVPNNVSRSAARAALDLADDDLVLLAIGLLRPYKGYERVIRLLPRLQELMGNRRVVFTIAGPKLRNKSSRDYVAMLRDEIARLPDPSAVHLTIERVDDDQVSALLSAADLSVAPYRSGLNSGVLFLNLTHAVPIVITSNAVTDEVARHGPVWTFEGEDDEALFQALTHCLHSTEAPSVDPQFLLDHSPQVVSGAFAEALRRRLRAVDVETRVR